MSDAAGIVLKLNGADYGGWLEQRASRSIEHVCGTFDLSMTDRWAIEKVRRELHPGDECQILLDGESVLNGYIDVMEPSYSATSHVLRVSGRDRTCDLVDCSAEVDAYEFMGVDLETIARFLCEKFEIGLRVETATGEPFRKFVVHPGETAFQVIERAAKQRGVLCTTDGAGDLVLCSRGTGTGDDLVEGGNILAARAPQDWRNRYSIYRVNGQMPAFLDGLDEPFEGQYGEAIDRNIHRYRPLTINCECYADAGGARARAEYECCCRAGKANRHYITVPGWRQSSDALWTPNLLVTVRSPMIDADGVNMIVAGVSWMVGSGGEVTNLELARPDAFLEDASGQVEEDPFGEW